MWCALEEKKAPRVGLPPGWSQPAQSCPERSLIASVFLSVLVQNKVDQLSQLNRIPGGL